MDIVRIPVQISDGAIVLSGVEDDQVDERAKLERSPDAEVVVHFDYKNATSVKWNVYPRDNSVFSYLDGLA